MNILHRIVRSLGCLIASGALASVGEDPRPNIILIMADDLGTETLGCYGGTSYRTPNIDRLAASGLRFNHAYATPLCTNTRVQLMTGKYQNRNWLAFGLLPPDELTFSHYMQRAGYKTCIVGKWQLYSYDPPDFPMADKRRAKGMAAKDAGFDEYCLWHTGHTEVKGSRYADPTIDENGSLRSDTQGKYGPDIWVDYLADFMTRHREERFFAYYAMALPHWPMVPTPESPEWNDPAKRLTQDVRFAKDMIEYTDRVVGSIIEKVEDLGLSDRTLILFYSDNGTDWRVSSRVGDRIVRGGKGFPTDAGTRVPLIAYWKGKTPVGAVINDLVDSTDFLPTLLEVGGGTLDGDSFTDGRSFYPRLLGGDGNPRDWIYMHQDPRPGWDKDRFHLIRFARNHRFKLYEDGRLYDIDTDSLEEAPIMPNADSRTTTGARQQLQTVLDSMKPYPMFDPRDMPREDPMAKALGKHAFQENNGCVVIEAESVSIPQDESWIKESSIPDSTGWGYLRSLRDQDKTAERGAVAFRSKLSSEGHWSIGVLHRRDHLNPRREDDFWLRVGSGPWMACRASDAQPIGTWDWNVEIDHPNLGTVPLSAVQFEFRRTNDSSPYGQNRPTIWIAPKSANIKIDRLALYQADRRSYALDRETPQSEFHPW